MCIWSDTAPWDPDPSTRCLLLSSRDSKRLRNPTKGQWLRFWILNHLLSQSSEIYDTWQGRKCMKVLNSVSKIYIQNTLHYLLPNDFSNVFRGRGWKRIFMKSINHPWSHCSTVAKQWYRKDASKQVQCNERLSPANLARSNDFRAIIVFAATRYKRRIEESLDDSCRQNC